MTEMIVAPKANEWLRLKSLLLDSVSSPIAKRVYSLGLDEFFAWYAEEPWPGFTKATVAAWRVALEERKLGSVSINVRITAVRKLARMLTCSAKARPRPPVLGFRRSEALHQAAAAEGCDFSGLGPHSFRRAKVTWTQEVGGSAIEASKMAGRSDLDITGDYTFVTPERQNELTRRIQAKLAEAVGRRGAEMTTSSEPEPGAPEVPPSLAETVPATTLLQ